MEYNEKKTSAKINGRNIGTAVPGTSAGNATSGGAAARDTEINAYEKANAGADGEVTVKNTEKAAGEEAENATGNASGRVGQNKRKIDREEILRQASESAMRAEKMADSILHICSAAEFLTERYVPKDKHSYAAENFREACPDDSGAGASASKVNVSGAGRSAGTSENAGSPACGASCGRKIPSLAVPVDFSTLGFSETSADEPVAPDECRIIILRHAQSLGNAKGSFLGHTDLDLTEQGFVQAEMVADFLDATHVHIDKIYSSDLMRAFHTALPSARRRGLLLSTTKELREVYMGKWEGRVVAELDAEYPEEFSIGWRQHFGTCVLPDGESVPHAARRVYDFVVSRAKENLGKTIMFTSHAAAIRSFWGLALGVPFERMAEEVPFPGNASFSTMIWRSHGTGDGELTPLGFSIDTYLGDLRQTKHS